MAAAGANRFRLWIMKTTLFILLLGVAVLSGCATRYNVQLTNGAVITTKGKPKLDKTTGTYIFKDMTGNPFAIPSVRVQEIAPASMSSRQSGQSFRSTPSK